MSSATVEMHARTTAANSTASDDSRRSSLAYITPRHGNQERWPWVSETPAMRSFRMRQITIENTFWQFPKATRFYVQCLYARAAFAIQRHDVAFLFSTAVGVGITRLAAMMPTRPPMVYVGFTQDGAWPEEKISSLSVALQRCDAVTVFSQQERDLYIDRFQLNPDSVHVIPIHTDESHGYQHYADVRPTHLPTEPYAISLGSPNRRFTPLARTCRALKIPLVIITRPTHSLDSLSELADLGATVITDADKPTALTYLKHARLGVMAFQTPTLPGAFTTLIHAMFLRTPCIVTECLGIRDYVVDGQTGVVTPHGDESALAAAIEHAWRSPETLVRFATRGLERAEQLYSLNVAGMNFAQLTRRVIECDTANPRTAKASSRRVEMAPRL